MSADLPTLKAAVPLPEIVTETHDIGRDGKVLCPAPDHDDHTPSCHIYPDGFKCYSCGAHGDAVDWLEHVHGLSTAEAIRELERRAGGYVPPAAERRPAPPRRTVIYKPVDENVLEAHHRRAAQLDHVPAAMKGRGFTLADLQKLGFRTERHDALFPVFGPNGTVLNIKRRKAYPKTKNDRYIGLEGHGSPAWCSPDFGTSETVLIIEGELNGAACWLAAPELAVMGVAGTGGKLHPDALKGRTVYVYADGDGPGQKARDKWAAAALEAGALKVYALEPWPADACDLAGKEGRATLRGRLTFTDPKPVQTPLTPAKPIARFLPDGERHKPDSCNAANVWGRAGKGVI